ncbi:unnamed protein product [Arabidopsis lyrata]|uniref:uncharacterized protein LOC9328016 isoform X2 n=1 Tax=Arabidopsis lyrata subsp. lyrata TaxID=81972 RepID=UPI000A29C45C|nr:uncharacterized protein LOC9328016 isoform X2 [Arabidopsis lyrata subsp. lyrata]CAH8256709.1 unnamed protein product [Arabidopsis lyrata]|eukprot:XP_020868310.1 uncharacterized protein LOC9328016 isoform X2 [Arabidopsis lyrata subsp. lyrata]
MIKIIMMMALVMMGVKAKTVMKANEVDQRVICYRNCDVGCGTDNACHQRCKKNCGYPPLKNFQSSDTRDNEVDQRVICYRNCDVGCGTDNVCHQRWANEVDQRVICYRNCDVGCGTDNACHQRCKKTCGYPPLMNIHL